MALTLTAANSVIMLSIDGLFNVPQQLQGFAADDVFDSESVDTAEIVMGIDGHMSFGWIPVPRKQTFNIQADSPSNAIFDAWASAQQAVRELYVATGIIRLPSISVSYAMTRGILSAYKPTPQVQKTIRPRQYGITWESVLPAPV